MVHAGSKIAAAAAALALGTLLAGSAFARSQVVGSFESAMKESQFQGPTSRVYGPDSNGRFLVTTDHGPRWHRHRWHRRYR